MPTSREGRDHAYLTDFGLTKQAGSESGLTRAGAFMGTPAYMAPEQIEGRDVEGRADQYSLAAMAFEMLTGVVPFKRDQEIAVAMAHLKDPVPSAVALRPDLPATVDTVLAQGMAKEPVGSISPIAPRSSTTSAWRSAAGAVAARPIRRRQSRGAAPGRRHFGPRARRRRRGWPLRLGSSAQARSARRRRRPAPRQHRRGGRPRHRRRPDPSTFPSGAEAALLARLPDAMTTDCRRGSYRMQDVSGFGDESAARPAASIICDLSAPDGPDQIGFVTFSAPAGQADRWTTHQVDASQGNVPGAAPGAGDCAVVPKAVGSWSLAGASVGTFGCYERDGVSWLYWAYQDANMAAFASSAEPDRGSLVAWWEANARFLLP